MQKYSVLMSLYQKEHPEYFRETLVSIFYDKSDSKAR